MIYGTKGTGGGCVDCPDAEREKWAAGAPEVNGRSYTQPEPTRDFTAEPAVRRSTLTGGISVLMHRLALRVLLPAALRSEYGEQMEETFDVLHRDAAGRSRAQAFSVLTREVWSAFCTGARARMRLRKPRTTEEMESRRAEQRTANDDRLYPPEAFAAPESWRPR